MPPIPKNSIRQLFLRLGVFRDTNVQNASQTTGDHQKNKRSVEIQIVSVNIHLLDEEPELEKKTEILLMLKLIKPLKQPLQP